MLCEIKFSNITKQECIHLKKSRVNEYTDVDMDMDSVQKQKIVIDRCAVSRSVDQYHSVWLFC